MSAEPYIDALEGLGLTVMVGADLGYYQGDWVGLVKDDAYDADDAYGFVVVGYGSCSGCDAWQAVSSPAERIELVQKILASGKWTTEFDDIKAYVAEKDKDRLNWFTHEDGWPAFAAAVAAADEYTEAGR